MKAHELVGATFEHPSIDMAQIHKWSVTKVDDRTDYVYVERAEGDGKLGQWVPGEWVLEFMEPKRLRLKIDSLRKSRDYFKNERDDLNKRLTIVSISNQEEMRALVSQLDFMTQEMILADKDIRTWKSLSIYIGVAGIVLSAALLVVKMLS
jgi:hypothetical protein